jgi:hypothetical protein
MPHVIEPATSGRAKCRGCGQKIEQGEPRFGERRPNAFGDGETTLWLHPSCAALKRPEPFLEALAAQTAAPAPLLAQPAAAALKATAERGLAHRRLPRLDGAERAATGRARCRSCREPIEKGSWRLTLVFFEEYRFEPAGFIHAACAEEYLGTIDVLDRIQRLSPELDAEALRDLSRALAPA